MSSNAIARNLCGFIIEIIVLDPPKIELATTTEKIPHDSSVYRIYLSPLTQRCLYMPTWPNTIRTREHVYVLALALYSAVPQPLCSPADNLPSTTITTSLLKYLLSSTIILRNVSFPFRLQTAIDPDTGTGTKQGCVFCRLARCPELRVNQGLHCHDPHRPALVIWEARSRTPGLKPLTASRLT